MDLKCVLAVLLCVNLTLAIHITTNTFPSSNEGSYSAEDERLQKPIRDTKSAPIRITSRYDVTENILDVPNTSPVPGIANATYEINKPLNHANPTNINENAANDGIAEEEKMYKQLENNYNNILQIIQTHQGDDDHEEMIDVPQFMNDFKEFLDGLQHGFVHGIRDVGREVETEVEDSDVQHFLTEPFSYIKKLFKGRN